MAKEYKITFKKGKHETGLARVTAGTPHTTMKYKKKISSYIEFNNSWLHNREGVKVRFRKKVENVKCGWIWVSLKEEFKTEEEARKRVQEVKDQIIAMAYFDEGDE